MALRVVNHRTLFPIAGEVFNKADHKLTSLVNFQPFVASFKLMTLTSCGKVWLDERNSGEKGGGRKSGRLISPTVTSMQSLKVT